MRLFFRALIGAALALPCAAQDRRSDEQKPAAAPVALDKRELDQLIDRFRAPDRFATTPAEELPIHERAAVALAQQLGVQSSPLALRAIVDALAEFAGAPDDEETRSGEVRLELAAALAPLADRKVQADLLAALRKRTATGRAYLARSFALRVLAEWSERGHPCDADPPSREWWLAMRDDKDFRLALQAWTSYAASADDGELWELYTKAFATSKAARPAQCDNLVMQEVGSRASLRANMRKAFTTDLFTDERVPWSTRREAWLTWLLLTPDFVAPPSWSAREGNPYLKRLFRQPRGPATSSDAPGTTRAPPSFFRLPLATQRAVFVIDQSPSMQSETVLSNGRKIVPSTAVEQEFQKYLKQLGEKPAERGLLSLAVIFFAGEPGETIRLVVDGRWDANGLERLARCWGHEGSGTNIYEPLRAAFRDTDADTVVFFSDGEAMRGVYACAEAIASEVVAWNRGRGTRVITLGAKPASPAPTDPALANVLQLLPKWTDGVELYLEDCP